MIGAGISGLTAAYAMRDRHDVTLFEAEAAPGGHATTIAVDGPGAPLGLDIGFIVYNEHTYPRFTALLRELGVSTQPSDMSFGVSCARCGLEFSSRGLGGFFAQRRRLAHASHWRTLAHLFRFYRDARRSLDEGTLEGLTLHDYLRDRRFGRGFRRHFLVPLTAAVWSTAPARVGAFPAEYLLRFLDNHGLIGHGQTFRWRTVSGGSQAYVTRMTEALPRQQVVLADPVTSVRRSGDGVDVATGSGSWHFDRAVIAAHADSALAILSDADETERAALGGFEYARNRIVVHTDERVLPAASRARASWNVRTSDCHRPADTLTMTYDLNRLQSVPGSVQYCVSVNPATEIRGDAVIEARIFDHPQYTFATLAAQGAVKRLQGHRRTYYAGAHLGYGFHEDGCRSGYEAAALIEGRVAA